MNYFLKFMTILVVAILVATALFSQVNNKNSFRVSIDPKHASTIFIQSNKALKVETWDEPYIEFQIEIEPYTGTKEALLLLELSKPNIIGQRFTVNNFLYLTLPDISKVLGLNDCKKEELFTFKIIVPKNLDLELNCKNDLVIHDNTQIEPVNDTKQLKAYDDK